MTSFSTLGFLQPGGGIATSALNVREFVLGAYLQEGAFEEGTVVGDVIRQTEAGHKYALEVARHNVKGMTIERFAQLRVQGGILANVYTHVRPSLTLPAVADSRMHEDFKQGGLRLPPRVVGLRGEVGRWPRGAAHFWRGLCGGVAYHPAHGA